MTGWKSKLGGIGGILTGAAMIVSGVLDNFNLDTIQKGALILFGGFSVLGVAHKIEKAGNNNTPSGG